MDKFSLYVPNFLPCKEYFTLERNNACPGCGVSLAVRHVYKVLEQRIESAMWLTPGENGCKDIFGVKDTDVSFLRVPKVKAGLVMCFDNEAEGSLTKTLEKPLPHLAIAEGFSYVATACPSYPFDLYDKVRRGMETAGNAYLHVLCPCPEGWQFEPELTVKVGYWAVESRSFPLYEVADGFYHITITTPHPRKVVEYLKAQKRFEHLTEHQIEEAQVAVEDSYRRLVGMVQKYLDTTGMSAPVN